LRLRVTRRVVGLKRPLQSAHGVVGERELLTVELTDGDGVSGYGEAAPFQEYDGVSTGRVLDALERYGSALIDVRTDGPSGPDGPSGASGAQIIELCRRIEDLPQALAAVDMALWDRAGRRAGKAVAELLTDDPGREVKVNATLGATDRQGAAEQAVEAVSEGFECIKVKVGVGDDAGRVGAVRAAAGSGVALRLDANGAWGVEEAVRAIETLAVAGLELVEEPTHGLEGVREVRERVSTRIAIDETAEEAGALGAGVADAVCLKISRCGGISGLIAAATLVRASGGEVYVASTLDGPLGVSAALHAAAALASRGPVPPCGLATLRLFEGIEDQLPAVAGTIALPTEPGLGVRPL
jgi:L-Ala-D/L-Glu epimerase